MISCSSFITSILSIPSVSSTNSLIFHCFTGKRYHGIREVDKLLYKEIENKKKECNTTSDTKSCGSIC